MFLSMAEVGYGLRSNYCVTVSVNWLEWLNEPEVAVTVTV